MKLLKRHNTAVLILLLTAAGISLSLPQAHAQEAASDSSGVVRVIDTALAWQKIAEARQASGKDRHREAVAYYLEALSYDARLVSLVAQELAYQKLWREDAEKSIF